MYRHTQIGWVIIISMGGAALFSGSLSNTGGEAHLLVAILLIFLVLFCTLTVTVDNRMIEARFGPGPIRKRVLLADVASCREVRIHWWDGWGIHGRPGQWLFNVSGFDAVEITLKKGGLVLIGTDEPLEFCRAIKSRMPRT